MNKQQLQSHIESDIDACNRLLKLLGDEREALTQRDTEQLETIIQEKTSNLEHLEGSANARAQWLRQGPTSYDDLESAWQALLAEVAPDLETQWSELRDLLKQCQAENEVNGKILARNQHVFKRLLGILRGQSDNGDLYTPKGGQRSSDSHHHLGKA